MNNTEAMEAKKDTEATVKEDVAQSEKAKILEEYGKKVDAAIEEIENFIGDEKGLLKPGMMDAMPRVVTNMLKVHIDQSDSPAPVVEGQLTNTVGLIANELSNHFFAKHGKPLFGLPAPKVEETADE